MMRIAPAKAHALPSTHNWTGGDKWTDAGNFFESRIAAASTVKFLLDRVMKLCRKKPRKPTQLKGYLCSGL